MSLPATDTFNRGTGLGSNWTTVTGFNAMQILNSLYATGTASGDNSMAYWNADTPGNDQYVIITIYQGNDYGDDVAAIARLNTSTTVAYWADLYNAQVYLYYYDGEGWTEKGAYDCGTPSNGDTFELQLNGTDGIVLYNDTERINQTCSELSSGVFGMYSYWNQTSHLCIDTWEGGNLGGVADLEVSESDGVTIASTVTLSHIPYTVSESDSLTIADTPGIAITGLFEVSVSDTISVADSVGVGPLVLANISVSDGITVGDAPSINVVEEFLIDVADAVTISESIKLNCKVPGAIWEPFENDIGDWFTTQDTSGTGSTVTQSATQAEGGTYSARCFTTNSGAKAQIRDSAFSSPWSGVPSANPGEHYWQRFSVYIPSATASAITGSEYVDIGAAYASSGGDGWFLRLEENAALYLSGPGNGGQDVFSLWATMPTDEWVSVEMGLWSQNTGDLDRAFAVLINGTFYGWFTNGDGSTDYDRMAAGIIATNSSDDLVVYIDNWRAYSEDVAPTGTDNRPTGSQYTLDYRNQSGENVGFHYTTWENGFTYDPTYGLTPSNRIQSGAELSNLDDLTDGWSVIEMEWADGSTPPWPPEGTGSFYAPMIAFHKSVELEENLELTFIYRSGSGVTDMVYESWTLSGAEYATWEVPEDHVTGHSQPGQGDKIRVWWSEVSSTEIRVVADYYDASADTWYLSAIDDTRALNNVNGVDFLDGEHLAVTNTIDSADYTITYQTVGAASTYGIMASVDDGVSVGDTSSLDALIIDVSEQDDLTVDDSPSMSPMELGMAVTPSAAYRRRVKIVQ